MDAFNFISAYRRFCVFRCWEADTIVIAQGELSRSGSGSRDGQLMSVSATLRSFVTLLSLHEYSKTYGDWIVCPQLISTIANTRRNPSKISSKEPLRFRISLYSVDSRITIILRWKLQWLQLQRLGNNRFCWRITIVPTREIIRVRVCKTSNLTLRKFSSQLLIWTSWKARTGAQGLGGVSTLSDGWSSKCDLLLT